MYRVSDRGEVGPAEGTKSRLTHRIGIEHVAHCRPSFPPKPKGLGPLIGHYTRGIGALNAAPPESVRNGDPVITPRNEFLVLPENH